MKNNYIRIDWSLNLRINQIQVSKIINKIKIKNHSNRKETNYKIKQNKGNLKGLKIKKIQSWEEL